MGNPDKDKLPVSSSDIGHRLDIWLHTRIPAHSRARWQELIKSGKVRVNGAEKKTRYLLREGDVIEFEIPPPRPVELVPEDKPLDILYEDKDLLVLNKPPGLVVHPAPGHDDGTLVNALLFHCHDLAGIGGELRPGIVHRLDKDTSGLLIVAKNETAMAALAAQFKSHRVRKEYLALVWGQPVPAAGTVDTLIGRSLRDRKKMSTHTAAGRQAITHYETLHNYADVSLLRLRIETGRTHQIRVHMTHLGHPIVGDTQYGRARKNRLPAAASRQMLHAERIAFEHPRTGKAMEFTAPIPGDMQALIEALGKQD